MKRTAIYKFYLYIIIVSVSISCDTNKSIDPPFDKYFVKYYGEDGAQSAVDLVVNTDGTFLILGKSDTGIPIILIKADAQGNLLWQKKLGESTDVPQDLELTGDGKAVILSNHTTGNGSIDIKLLLISLDGNRLDSVIYGSPKDDVAKSVTPLRKGGYIVTGTSNYDEGNKGRLTTVFHYRCDANFKFLDINSWREYYGQGAKNAGTKVIQDNDSLYVFGYSNHHEGRQNSPDLNQNMFYYRLTSTGEGITPVYLENSSDDIETSLAVSIPSPLVAGYLMIGTSNRSLAPKLRLAKVKAPLRFSVTDDRQFELNAFSSHQLQGISATPSLTSPSGYLLLSKETNAAQGEGILLSKVDLNGGEVWSVQFGTSQSDEPVAIAELSDGRIVMLCTINLDVQLKIGLFKLNSKGEFLK